MTKKVFFEDYTFNIHEKVYEPAEDSLLFAKNLEVNPGETVVDIGVGCGILAVVSAAKAGKVVAVDINPYAVRCAKKNANLNGFSDNIFFVQGNLFSPFNKDERFDLILFNAPYLPSFPSEKKSWIEFAWNGGVNGREVIDRFISKAPEYMEVGGRILLLQSTLADIHNTLRNFENKRLHTNIITRKVLPFFEEIILLQVNF